MKEKDLKFYIQSSINIEAHDTIFVACEELGYDFSAVVKPVDENDMYALRYSEFVVPLVKAVQEQQGLIDQQQKQIDELTKQVQELLRR